MYKPQFMAILIGKNEPMDWRVVNQPPVEKVTMVTQKKQSVSLHESPRTTVIRVYKMIMINV